MCFMSNPAGGDSKQQLNTNNANATLYNGNAAGVDSTLLPFLDSEVTNPQGFGDTAVNEMKTTGGEAVSGAQGQATEAAQLLGSRTGNTAAAPGIIDVASRNAMKQNSTNAMNVDLANNAAKLTQQQQGAGGLQSQYSTDVAAALSSLGLANSSIGAENSAFGNSFGGQLADNLGKSLGTVSFH